MKKKGRTKRSFRQFRYVECDAFAEYLQHMAAKGWHFRKWQLGLVFEKGEPADVVYDVQVFQKGSEMDLKPEADAEEYAEYCEKAGWTLVDGMRKFCVFRRERPDADPIVTEEERFRQVWKAEQISLLQTIIVPVLLLLNWGLNVERMFQYWIFSDALLLIGAAVTGLFLLTAGEMAALLVWRFLGKRKLAAGEKIRYGRRPGAVIDMGLRLCIVVGGVGFLFQESRETAWIYVGVAVAVILVTLLLVYSRPDRGSNWVMQIGLGVGIFFLLLIAIGIASFVPADVETVDRNAVPLVLSDVQEGAPPSYEMTCERSSGILGNRLDVWCSGGSEQGEASLSYELYRSRFSWVLDRLTEQKTKYREAEFRDCADAWDAQESWTVNGREYVVRYEEALLYLLTEAEPDETQIRIIREKLGLLPDEEKQRG